VRSDWLKVSSIDFLEHDEMFAEPIKLLDIIFKRSDWLGP